MRIASRSGANARSRSQNGDVGADQRHRRGELRRRRERPAQIDALRRGEQLDRDDARGVRRHRRQPARGEGRHADVVFLVRRGRQRVDRRRVRERLVLRRERRRGHLRDHEAGVHAAVLDQERRQAGQVGVHQQRDAPLGQRADLGDREREVVRRERDRLGVEVAAGEDLVGVREHQRIVRHRVRFDERASPPRAASGRGRRPSPAAGSAGCRDPARAGSPCARRGSRCLRAARGRSPPRRPGRDGRAPRGCARSNGVSLPRHASTDSAPATNAAASARSAANRPASASAVDTCVPLRSARPSFGPSVDRLEAGPRQRVARRHDAAVDSRLAFADQHRRQGARAARGRPRRRPIPAPGCTARRPRWRARRAPRSRSSARPSGRARARLP